MTEAQDGRGLAKVARVGWPGGPGRWEVQCSRLNAKQCVLWGLCLAVFLACLGLRLSHWSRAPEVREFPDTRGYMTKSSWPLWPQNGWIERSAGIPAWLFRGRSLTTPLFYKLAGNTPGSIATFQLILAIACWTLLAVTVARAVQTAALKPLAFAIVMLFSLSDQIIMWDSFLLSDSIALSLMALFVACWLWLLEGWTRTKAALLATVAFFWTFTRDTNAWVILLLAAVLITFELRSRRSVLLAAVLFGLFAANEISQAYARRWVTPFVNVLGQRILPDAERREDFASHGMPLTPAVMRLSGQLAWSQNHVFYKDAELRDLREWVYTRGKVVYLRFLISHPVYTVTEPFRKPDELLRPDFRYFRARADSTILGGWLARLIYLETWSPVLLFAPLILVLLAFAGKLQGQNRNIEVASLILILLFYPHAVVAWHGDSNDVARHALLASVHLRLGFWLLLIWYADILLGAQLRNMTRRALGGRIGARRRRRQTT